MSNLELFNKIKNYYDEQLWNESRVRNMVKKNIITKEEYKQIVGKDFE